MRQDRHVARSWVAVAALDHVRRGVAPAPIEPLLEKLGFIGDVRHLGYPLRRGPFEIERDLATIAKSLGVSGL
jgi:hypothetical protein